MRKLVAAIGIAVLAATACADDDGASPTTFPPPGGELDVDVEGIGDPVPADLRFEAFDGVERELAEYSGRPLVLNFFASWCVPCVREMPAIEAVHRALGDEVAFLGLSVQDTAEDSQALVERTGVTYDTARDPSGEVFAALGAVVMPTTFLVDAGGRIVAAHSGDIDEDELSALVAEHFS